MNVVRENRADLTTLLKVTVTPADYAGEVEKALREYKRKANIPGFRPGMVPMGIINKMYRKGVLAEEAYRTASKACFDYLETEKIDYIGDVMPSESQQPLDFDAEGDYEFVFEVGTAPEVKIELSTKDTVDRYRIEPTDDMREGFRTNYLRRFGKLVDVEKAEKDEALDVTLDNESMQIENAYVGLISMSDEERKPFLGKKVGDKMQVNVNELYKTPSQRASVLQLKESELEGIDPNFELTITKIRKFAEPELNEEFFKEAFPGGEVKTKKEFDAFIEKQIEAELVTHTDDLFERSMQKMLAGKARLTLPEQFIKRWLLAINEGKFSPEEIDRDFPQFVDMMQWNLICKHFINTLNLSVTQEDMVAEAKINAQQQFAQYGMPSVGDEMLTSYAQQMLSNKQEANKISEKLFDKKIIAAITPIITVVEKSVSPEQFGKKVEELR